MGGPGAHGAFSVDATPTAGPQDSQQNDHTTSPKRRSSRTGDLSNHNRRQSPVTFLVRSEEQIAQSYTPQHPQTPPERSAFGVESFDSTTSSISRPDTTSTDPLSEAQEVDKLSTFPHLLRHPSDPTFSLTTSPIPLQPPSPRLLRSSPTHALERDVSTSALSGPLIPLHLRSPVRFPRSDSASTPRSISLRSLRLSDDDAAADDSSQAIESSDEEEDHVSEQHVQPTTLPASDLVMPTMHVPKRRPFTDNGRRVGNLKIAVAGSSGSGKTSLVQAIVEICEDIVHTDEPVLTGLMSTTIASTRPCPEWWTSAGTGRLPALRRRSSILRDTVLDRNITFLEAPCPGQALLAFCEQMFEVNHNLALASDDIVLGVLSGHGGAQVDLVLYLLPSEPTDEDIASLAHLSRLTSVVPVIAKADTMSEEEIRITTTVYAQEFQRLDLDLLSLSNDDWRSTHGSTIWPVSSARVSDEEVMDASLLMSSAYFAPLIPSSLSRLVRSIFDADHAARLRHLSAQKYLGWRRTHGTSKILPQLLTDGQVDASCLSAPPESQVLVSRPGLPSRHTMPASHAPDQSSGSHWTTDLKRSLHKERQRYDSTTSPDRRGWLIERWRATSALTKQTPEIDLEKGTLPKMSIQRQDPLGLLAINDALKGHGVILARLLGGCGILGAVMLFLSKSLGRGPLWGCADNADSGWFHAINLAHLDW